MIKKGHVLLASIFLLFLLTACNHEPPSLSIEDANDIAQAYFYETHSMLVNVEDVSLYRASQTIYLNLITVECDQIEYKLMLDEDNRPLADDVSCVNLVRKFDMTMIEEKIKPLSLVPTSIPLMVNYKNAEKQYAVTFIIEPNPMKIPNLELKETIFDLLAELKKYGVDELVIMISTPDFLVPKVEFGLGTGRLQLYAMRYSTELSIEDFEKKYVDDISNVFWDEHKFEDKIVSLSNLGYKNICFYISHIAANSITISLYLESDKKIYPEQEEDILKGLNDSYFKIGQRNTIFALAGTGTVT